MNFDRVTIPDRFRAAEQTQSSADTHEKTGAETPVSRLGKLNLLYWLRSDSGYSMFTGDFHLSHSFSSRHNGYTHAEASIRNGIAGRPAQDGAKAAYLPLLRSNSGPG